MFKRLYTPTYNCRYSGWWFQPLWTILVSWDDYFQYIEKYKMFQATNQTFFSWLGGSNCLFHIVEQTGKDYICFNGKDYPNIWKIKNVWNHQTGYIESTINHRIHQEFTNFAALRLVGPGIQQGPAVQVSVSWLRCGRQRNEKGRKSAAKNGAFTWFSRLKLEFNQLNGNFSNETWSTKMGMNANMRI